MTAAGTSPVAPMVLGALGDPNTFGGQAANLMLAAYPEFSEIVYLPTSEVAFGACGNWQSDASCVPEQTSRTGFHVPTQRKMVAARGRLKVVAEISHQYHCGLFVKPGSKLSQIRRVLGHTGSINQSRGWITEHVPGAEIEIVATHSMGAARAVVASDGSLACVCTPELGQGLGLEQLATDIDGGSVGHYWAVSPHERFAERPTRLVVPGETSGGSMLSDLLAGLSSAGFHARTVWTEHTGTALFTQQVVVALSGEGALDDVRKALDATEGSFWLAGAFVSREEAE